MDLMTPGFHLLPKPVSGAGEDSSQLGRGLGFGWGGGGVGGGRWVPVRVYVVGPR